MIYDAQRIEKFVCASAKLVITRDTIPEELLSGFVGAMNHLANATAN